ncbi:MAG: hypothetical protein GXP18_02225 [Gammaproteobacteria bacterium]|nr:hypothetical protein [Gammaproteobacteria bacterium]
MSLKTILGGSIGIVIVMLVGCGGNDPVSSDPPSSSPPLSNPPPSNSPPSSPPSSSVDNVTLGGAAAKGIINGGNVVAEELDISGTVIARVGKAITAADGSYTLEVSDDYSGGPIQVTVSAGADTWMKCDVPSGCGTRTDDIADSDTGIDFSEWYKPGSLTMMALVAEAVANDTISVNITPYTNLAAKRAMATGQLTPDAVYNANSEVSNLLGGIDILSTWPLDITDTTVVGDGGASEIAYAAFSAAIAALADTSGGNPDINAVLATLSGSFGGGTIVADDAGTATDDSTISLQEIVDGATNALAQAGIADTSGIVASLQADINDATGGSVDPQPGPVTGDTALARVKAFVNDVRTWGTVIEEETRVKGDAFSTQVDLASTAADASMSLVVGPALGSTIDAVFMRLTDTMATELGGGDYVVGIPGNPQFESGTITYSGGVVTITDGVIDGVTVNLSLQLPDDKSTATSSLTGVINSATFMSASTDLIIDSGTIVATLVTPYSIDYAALDMGTADEPDISGGSVSLDVTLTQKQDDSGAELASPVTFAGTLLTTLINPVKDDTTGEITWLTPSTLTLTGNISDTIGNSLDASFTANISNADTFEPAGSLVSDSSFVLPEDVDNWLAGTVGLDFVLQLDGLPEASVNISGDRTAFETGAATITITYGVRQLIIVGAFTDNSSTGSMTIINQDGVAMSIVGGDFDASTGDIEYNGQIYGSIDKLTNGLTKITYIDGTFESF